MFKNENGFSLVELAIAAGLAVALAATAVTILSGTTATLSSKANGAAGTSSTYNSDVLANASGVAGGGSASTGTLSAVFTKGTDFGMGSSSQMYDRTWAGDAELQFYTGSENPDAKAAVLALKAGDIITAGFTSYPSGTVTTASAAVISVSDQGYQIVVRTEMFNVSGSWSNDNTIQFTYN